MELRLGDTGPSYLGQLRNGDQISDSRIVEKASSIPWRLEHSGRRVRLTAAEVTSEAVIAGEPKHLFLHVTGGAAVFLDLTLHRPIQ